MIIGVTYASSQSSDLLIPTLEFKNEAAGVIRLFFNNLNTPLFLTMMLKTKEVFYVR